MLLSIYRVFSRIIKTERKLNHMESLNGNFQTEVLILPEGVAGIREYLNILFFACRAAAEEEWRLL